MNNQERLQKVFSFQKPDRLPLIEWASWWDKTLDRWLGESAGQIPVLQAEGRDEAALHRHFGLDPLRQLWVSPRSADCPQPAHHGAALVTDRQSYQDLKPCLFPELAFDHQLLSSWFEDRAQGGPAIWFTLEGFFWFPRHILGIENHLFAFYDQPDLMNEINRDLAAFHLRVVEEICAIGIPDFMTFAEDLSYNRGPMISAECFREFLLPWYHQVVPALKAKGITVIVDSDGDIAPAVPWFIEAGIQGILPLERQAGVDITALQKAFPDFIFIGGFDKMVMKQGETAMRSEFDRLLPALRRGGYIPSVDHQTPPDVSLDNYRIYVRLLEEYCRKACG